MNEDHLASDLIGILREWGKDFEMRNIRIYLFDFQLIISNNFIKFVFIFFSPEIKFLIDSQDDQKVKVNIVSKLMTDLIRHRHRLMCFSHTQV